LGQQFEFAVRTGVKPDKSAIPTAAHQPITSGLAALFDRYATAVPASGAEQTATWAEDG
jgi:hypothetical protein